MSTAGREMTGAALGSPDWSSLPRPEDDGAARHLEGARHPALELPSSDGSTVDLAALPGSVVLFLYPMTGTPGRALPDGWDAIPGARGCTSQACAFRDLAGELRRLGASRILGVSSQPAEEQREAVARLRLPYPLLSDEAGALRAALDLPTFEAGGRILLRRMSWIVEDGHIAKVFHPVFPPDEAARDVAEWLSAHRTGGPV